MSKSRLEKVAIRGFFGAVISVCAVMLVIQTLTIKEPPKYLRERFGMRSYSGMPCLEMSIVNWQLANYLKRTRPVDILFLGDSSCLMDIKPAIVSSSLGLTSWNLGTIGHLGVTGHAALLREALRNVQPPKVVVYQVTFASITGATELAFFYKNILKDWLGQNDVPLSLVDRLPAAKLRNLLLYKLSRFSESAGSQAAFYRKPRGPYPSDDQTRIILEKSGGWFPELPNSRISRDEVRSTKFADLNPENELGLRELIAYSKKYNFKLLIQLAPFPAGCENDKVVSLTNEFQELVQKLAKGNPDVYAMNPITSKLPVEYFATLNHLTPSGAELYSAKLSTELRSVMRTSSVCHRVDSESVQ